MDNTPGGSIGESLAFTCGCRQSQTLTLSLSLSPAADR